MNIYQENGFENRTEYVRSLAEQYDVQEEVAFTMAELLGPSEDFDGLLNTLEDISEGYM